MSRYSATIGCLLALTLAGCWSEIEEQTKKSPNSIIGKKTQDVGEFDPNAKQQVSDSKVRANDPMLYALQAYGPIMEQVSKLGIDHAVNLFNAEKGRYPKDHEEFMTEIIKRNNIRLPVLPNGAKYKYDVANHKLEVVKPAPAAEEAPAKTE